MTVALYALWCGFCWLLRGGKFGAIYRSLFSSEPGTTITRLSCAALIAAPLAAFGPAYVLLAISIFAAMTIGYLYESMGVKDWQDVTAMSMWGVTVQSIMLLPIAALAFSTDPFAPAVLGLLAGPIYYVNRLLGRRLGLDWTERAEIAFGVTVGLAILGAIEVSTWHVN